MIKKINPNEVPDEKVKSEWLKNKLVISFNHQPIQEDEDLHEVIRTSRYSKMRVNVNFKHNIIDPEKKEQVCLDFLEVLEMMYQATSYRDVGVKNQKNTRVNRPQKILDELDKCIANNPESFERDVKKMLEQLQKEDPTFESIKAFQHLVKVYTHNSCYYKLGLRFNQGRFTDVQTYTATLLDLTQKHIDKHCYKMYH